MTHTPPVPAGNQSPYPLQEAPHAAKGDAPPPGDPRVASTPPSHHTPAAASPATLIGIGFGLAAIAGGLFFALRASPPAPPKKRKKRKSAQA